MIFSNQILSKTLDDLSEQILLKQQTTALLSLNIAFEDNSDKKIIPGNFVFSKTKKSNGPSILGMVFSKGKDYICNLLLNDDDLRNFYQTFIYFMRDENNNKRNLKNVFEIGSSSQFKNIIACKVKENRYAGVQKIFEIEAIRSFSDLSQMNVYSFKMPAIKNINDDSVISGPILIIKENDAKKLRDALKNYLLGN